jgi:hypothetical protein
VVRAIIIKERRVPIVDYLLEQNARKYHPTLMRMSAAEIRQAKDKEWSGRKRAWLLEKMEIRLAQLAVAADKLVIAKNARKPTGLSGRLPLTIKEVEARIAALLMAPDTKANRAKIYYYTAMLRRKRVECISKAQKVAAMNEHNRLTKAQFAAVKRELGDHSCSGASCVLCGGQGLE